MQCVVDKNVLSRFVYIICHVTLHVNGELY